MRNLLFLGLNLSIDRNTLLERQQSGWIQVFGTAHRLRTLESGGRS